MKAISTLLLVSLTAAACGKPAGAARAPAEVVTPVRMADVVANGDGATITATGVLGAKDEVMLSFKIGGIVQRVLVDDGAKVRKGQVLAVLDQREIDAMMSKATAGAEKARRDAARAERLFKDSVATLAQMQDAQTARTAAEADLRAAKVNHEYATVVAPSDGVVLSRLVSAGQMVGPGSPVIQFGSSTRGKVLRMGLSDREALALRTGTARAPAEIVFDAVPGKVFKGRVSQIAASADPRTGTYAVEIAIEGAESLPSGLVGRATIKASAKGKPSDKAEKSTDQKRTYSIPAESIVEGDSASGTVYTVDATGKRARRLSVNLVSLQGDFVLVTGLDGVKRVVTSGASFLTDSAKVEIKP
jgi:RND family efflux transporter MFP subunit